MTVPAYDRVTGSIRATILALDPSSLELSPTPDLPNVWGLVLDWGIENDILTLVGLADETSSLYAASGRAVLGTGYLPAVHAATLALLATVEDMIELFPAGDTPDFPDRGFAAFTVLTYSTRRSVVVAEDAVRDEAHPLAAAWAAVESLMGQMRIAIRLISGPNFTPLPEHPVITYNHAKPPA